MNCANCSNEAIYVYAGSGVREVVYCYACLPSFLRPLAKSGLLPTTEAFNTVKERVMTQLLAPTFNDESVEEDAPEPEVEVAEESVAEESDVSEVKPVRKRKRAVKPAAESAEESQEKV